MKYEIHYKTKLFQHDNTSTTHITNSRKQSFSPIQVMFLFILLVCFGSRFEIDYIIRFLLRNVPSSILCLVIAVVSVGSELSAEDVLDELLDGVGVVVKPFHPSGKALARRQVDILQGGTVFQEPRQSFQVDRAATQVQFSEIS
jgi:hypothetical protein